MRSTLSCKASSDIGREMGKTITIKIMDFKGKYVFPCLVGEIRERFMEKVLFEMYPQ